MIRVKVERHNPLTGKISEIARMDITNDGRGTVLCSSYDGVTYYGRSAGTFDLYKRVNRRGHVRDWYRAAYHPWYLVAAMLRSMGFAME